MILNLKLSLMNKILILSGSFKSGGAEKRSIELANYFNKKNIPFIFAVIKNEGALKNRISNGINIHELSIRGNTYFGLAVFARLMSLIIKTNYRTIFSNLYGTNKYVLIASYFLKLNIYAGVFSNPVRYKDKFFYRLYPRAKKLVCNSKSTFNFLKKDLKIDDNKLVIINNGVQYNANQDSTNTFIDSNKTINIVTVASLRPVKGIDVLIKAIYEIKNDFNIKYKIIGEGPDRSKLQNLIIDLGLGKNVFLCGEKLNPNKYLNRADIFIFGSWYEGMPNAVLEAMAKKVPVISTKARHGIEEVVVDGFNGLLCERGDSKTIAILIKNLINDNELKNKLSHNGFETIKSNYNFDTMLKSYEKLLI